MSRLKVMTILGTRPEIIRLSRVMARRAASTEGRSDAVQRQAGRAAQALDLLAVLARRQQGP